MSLENYSPGSPADWLRHAYSDLELARARQLSDKVLLEELCLTSVPVDRKMVVPRY